MADRGTRRRALRLGAALAALLLAAPAAGAAERGYAKRVRSLLELRREGVAIQQWDLSCGAATLATLLGGQFGEPVTERQLAASMLGRTDAALVRKRLGFSLLDMKRELARRGYRGEGYGRLSLGDLLGLAPAIVPLQGPGYSHFVVVRGAAGGRVVVADPAYGNRTMDPERFAAAWRERIAFVARRPDGAAPPGRLAVDPAEVPLVSPQAVRVAIPRP